MFYFIGSNFDNELKNVHTQLINTFGHLTTYQILTFPDPFLFINLLFL